ncbi:DUF3054 domain-containing protein [Arthrobacter gandavensis]|uniref:DUF3054 domain-containing protein n=1 Tax=Arthrobacter gandavensis TaxID=169960 RepID=UPI0018902E84|nr:DUF3054 domain-containing protein [Arthrobacter gandavensis]MBF4995211.1 DUF3054 domain-containing protein [Arthrobacter gandavensis]
MNGPNRHWPVQLAADVVLILVFAALGRDTHAHGVDPAGVLLTASPFVAAALSGWALLRLRHRPASLWPHGILLWLITAGGGLAVRALAGAGTAFSFQLVTFSVLGAFLLLPRLASSLVMRRRTRNDSTRLIDSA